MNPRDETFLRTLLDTIEDGVYFVDRQRRILYWNHGAERISGYAADTVVGSHCWDNILQHVGPDGCKYCEGPCPLLRAIREERPVEMRAYLRHRDGFRVPVALRSMPMRDEAGSVIGAVEVFRHVPEPVDGDMDTLRDRAYRDPLTGLFNRRYMEDALDHHQQRLSRYDWNFGLVLLDVDNLKSVNDTHGHLGGDAALALVAGALREGSRTGDVVGRWGGDEFLILCDHVTIDSLHTVTERYRSLVALSAADVGGVSIQVTVSIGATLGRKDESRAELFARADACLYNAKQSGRNLARVT